jgi:ABC-type transport system substrate-binding protein
MSTLRAVSVDQRATRPESWQLMEIDRPRDATQARDLLRESGLSAAEQSDWSLFTNGGDEVSVTISQIVQSSLRQVGINMQLDVKQGAEFVDGMLQGRFAATFGGIGNIQKFPTRVTTNSIVSEVNSHRKYHPPRGCLGDPTCRLPGSYKGGQGWPDTGLNCTYTTHGGCSSQ